MKHIVLISAFCLLICSCGKVAQNGALLNSHVTDGIIGYQADVELLIEALADVQRGIVNDRWDQIYTSVELDYRITSGIDENSPLTRQQRLEIATIASSVRDQINSEIALHENELLCNSRLNAALLVELNETVTMYLNSEEELEIAKNRMNSRLEGMADISISEITESVSEFIEMLP